MKTIKKEEELNINHRYQKLIKWHGHSASAFAKEIGITRGALASILSGSSEPSYSTIRATLGRFKEVSSNWLIEGSGEMLNKENALKIEEESEVLKILRDQLQIKDQQILKYSESISELFSLINTKPKK
jgi:transcriptional regulator with XRE-family HTH domain